MKTPMQLPAMYSTIPPYAVQQFIPAAYDTDPVTSCRLLKRGWNDTYDAHTPGGRYVLRIYRRERTVEEVLYELHLIEHVHKQGAPAAAPIRSRDGSVAVRVTAAEGERCAALFPYIDGGDPELMNPDDMYHFGSAAARLHEAADSFVCEHERRTLNFPELLHDPITAVRPYLRNRPKDEEYLMRLSDRLLSRLDDIQVDGADRGPCHGDLHTGNLRSNAGSLVLFDFDFCGPCFRAYDIATFAGIMQMKRSRPIWDAFLNGYNDRRPLSEVDIALIPVLTAVRFIWLVGARVARSLETGEAWIDKYLDTWLSTLQRATRAMDAVPREGARLDDVINMVEGRSRSRRALSRILGR